MHAAYEDITGTMNRLLRDEHETYRVHMGRYPKGCTGADFEPDTCRCTVNPEWYDENGVPRYAPHHPKICPDIYADEVVLLEIGCQSCGAKFPVQMSQGTMHRHLMTAVWAKRFGIDDKTPIMRAWEGASLAQQVKDGIIHYGDPPRHGHLHHVPCCAGDTMNCDDLQVLEFWRRNRGFEEPEWIRVPELEVMLPDAGEQDASLAKDGEA